MKTCYLIWGLPGSGKSTLADALSKFLNCPWMNADRVRSTISIDLDFSMQSRVEQARRMAYLACLSLDSPGISNVVVDFVNPTSETDLTFTSTLYEHYRGTDIIHHTKTEDQPAILAGRHLRLVSIQMGTISPEDSRYENTRKVFQSENRKRSFLVDGLVPPEDFPGLANSIVINSIFPPIPEPTLRPSSSEKVRFLGNSSFCKSTGSAWRLLGF